MQVVEIMTGTTREASLVMPTWFGTPDRKIRHEFSVLRVRGRVEGRDDIVLWVDRVLTRPVEFLLSRDIGWGPPTYCGDARDGYLIETVDARADAEKGRIALVLKHEWIPKLKAAMEAVSEVDAEIVSRTRDARTLVVGGDGRGNQDADPGT